MNLRFSALCLAVLGGIGGLVAPFAAEAGNVGYYVKCGSVNPASNISAAGHTPIPISKVDSASLANLDGLVIVTCLSPYYDYQFAPVVDPAVEKGLRVMIDTTNPPVAFPGRDWIDVDDQGGCGNNLSLAPSSPIANGPGGILTDDSLDMGKPGGGPGSCSALGSAGIYSLPKGGVPLVLIAPGNGYRAAAFAYPLGRGIVAASVSQWMIWLQGGNYLSQGASTYYTNTIAWMMSASLAVEPPKVTCASEGYTGTKLTWCQNICEKGYTGATLNMWIQRWIGKYRDLPYCALEK